MQNATTVNAAPVADLPASTPSATRWRTEDWIAVVLGFLVITTVLVVFQWKVADLRNVVPTFRWTTDSQIASLTPGWTALARSDRRGRRREGAAERRRPQPALSRTRSRRQDRKAIEAAAGKLAALGSRTLAGALGDGDPRTRRGDGREQRVHAGQPVEGAVRRRSGFSSSPRIGIALLGARVLPFLLGLPVIFGLAFLARLLAGNGLFVDWGIEYVIFALALGLLISNTIGTPEWLKPAVQTEFFIKTGLVILGASLLFKEVLQAGALGIVQAVLVVFVVWYACFWLCPQAARRRRVCRHAVDRGVDLRRVGGDRRLRRDPGRQEEALLRHLARADRRGADDDRHAVDREVHRHERPGGGRLARRHARHQRVSVVAAGALISDAAMKTGVIVKFSQNALIGVAAFMLAIWWALKQRAATGERPSARVIWDRFPKFVIGFVIASALFSFALPPDLVSGTRSALGETPDLVVRAGVRVHRAGDALHRARHHRPGPAGAGLPRRAGDQRGLDAAARLAAVRRRAVRPAGDWLSLGV